MKKIVLFFVLLFSVVLATQAQTLQKESVMQLVAANSDAIGITKEQVSKLKISSTYADAGTQYVYLIQTIQGLPVNNQMLVLAFKNNQLISNAGKYNADLDNVTQSISPSLSAASAVNAAFLAARVSAAVNAVGMPTPDNPNKIDFGKLAGVTEKITAELMWQPVATKTSGITPAIPVQNVAALPAQDGKSTTAQAIRLGTVKPGQATTNQGVKLVWQVQVAPTGTADVWLIQIDAGTGSVVSKINLTVYEQNKSKANLGAGAGMLTKTAALKTEFNVAGFTPPPTVTSGTYNVVPYPFESPSHHAFQVVSNPWLNAGAGNNAITNGWHFDGTTNHDSTRGNNVFAYLDLNNSNAANGINRPAKSSTASPTLTFGAVQAPTQSPSIDVNRDVALTNLFYWNNVMHDITYQYGFNEVAGNFQADNLSRGGTGTDFVRAEAQDGGGLNNANFSTPPADGITGSVPRMQMYLFNGIISGSVKVNSPASIAGNYAFTEGGFSNANQLSTMPPVTAQLVYFNDATGGTHEACTGAPTNDMDGKIALINRGTCGFIVKVKEAQNAGAVGVIVVNNAPGATFVMGGTDNSITIPAVMVSDVDGAKLAAQLANNVNVTLSGAEGVRYDGDLDNGVVTHEYGHGISNRLTGGPTKASSCLTNGSGFEQGGEGWSDYGALMVTTDWASATVNDGTKARPVGTYVEHQPITGAGIRTYPYSTDMAINPWTYSGVQSSGGEDHTIGEIWCATIWDMTWAIIKQENAINTNLYNNTGVGGNSIALKLVYEGMKLQPCNPGFLDARNAIIKADINLFAGKHVCTIWAAFAKRGMGFSAVQGLASSTNDQVQAFDMPPAAVFTTQPANATVCVGGTATFTPAVTSPGVAATFQWQKSTDGGNNWTDIPGATSLTFTTPAATIADNGTKYRLVASTVCSGATTSNAATLTVIAAAVGGTLSPASTPICGAPNASGTLTLSGQSGVIIQWQQSIDGGANWTNISNTTTTLNYNITVTTSFRVLVQGNGCAANTFSSVATITFTAAPALSIIPDPSAIVCAGDPTRLTVMEGAYSTVAATRAVTSFATGITFNFKNNNPYAVTITDINSILFNAGSSNVSAYYNTTPVTASPTTISAATGWNQFGAATVTATGALTVQPFMSGLGLVVPAGATYGILINGVTAAGASNLIFSNTASAATTSAGGCDIIVGGTAGFITGALPPTVTQAPPAFSFIGNIRFKAASATSTGPFVWSPATGLSSTTSNPVAASPMVNTTYTVSNDNGAGCVRTASIAVTVNARPAITAQPSNLSACEGSNAIFNVTATGANLTYQWEESKDNCATYAPIAGATGATLTLSSVTRSMSGNGYHCLVKGACAPTLTTICATLKIDTLPTVSITPSGIVCGGQPGVNGVLLSTGTQPAPVLGTKTYSSGTVSVDIPEGVFPNPPATAGVSTITIPTGDIPSNAIITKISVTSNIIHNYVGDVIMVLKSPTGAIINLDAALTATNNPGSNFVNTVISSDNTKPALSTGTAPFTTEFKADLVGATFSLGGSTLAGGPVGYAPTTQTWTPLLSGNPAGGWVLAMYDAGAPDLGKLTNWSIKIDYAIVSKVYTWSPAAGLYTDNKATIPYIAGTIASSVYAAPTVATTYSAIASNPAGCIAVDRVAVNNTPLPFITQNPSPLCLGGITRLKNRTVNSTLPVWSPVTGLYTDANATIPYVAGTPRDTIWAKPTVNPATYNVDMSSAASPITITQATTGGLFQARVITFNVKNKNLYPVIFNEIATLALANPNVPTQLWFKRTAINGLPGAISAANGWTQAATGTLAAPANDGTTIQTFFTGLNLQIKADSTFGIALLCNQNGGGILFTSTNTTVATTAGGVDLISGVNVSFAGNTAPPGAPTLVVSATENPLFIGTIKVTPVIAPACAAPTQVKTLNVNTPLSITTQPTASAACTDKPASFTTVVAGSAFMHNWKVSTNNGVNWADIANGGVYSGANSGTLVITAPPVSMSGYLYKDSISTNPCTPIVSDTVKLTVNSLPALTLTASPFTKLFPGLTTTLSAGSTPAASTYAWQRNGVTVSGATSGTLKVDVTGLGDYTVKINDVNGCSSASNVVSITDSASGRLFIYPNPNSGQFQVRYYSLAGNTNLARGINVYDARGKRILVQAYSISTPFARMDVDLRNYGSGVYWIELVDINGNRLAVGRAEVLR